MAMVKCLGMNLGLLEKPWILEKNIMFRKSEKGYYFWSDFLKKYGIFNAFSTKKFGNLKIKNLDSSCFEDFCNSLGIKKDMVTGMREVHGRDVVEVTKNSQLNIVDSVDGLISSKKN